MLPHLDRSTRHGLIVLVVAILTLATFLGACGIAIEAAFNLLSGLP